ncbi:hypothetical protein VP1G_11394 [Cytospora mali]|uniref:Uncharacterized protein n=1 Tax=Cytospora mali TaxID=578113 RepID=A0A194VEF7_CYTMA|nr:hypothetical protein VP1G_11394 [Valsa mali var. pyri (nom. inval.)]
MPGVPMPVPVDGKSQANTSDRSITSVTSQTLLSTPPLAKIAGEPRTRRQPGLSTAVAAHHGGGSPVPHGKDELGVRIPPADRLRGDGRLIIRLVNGIGIQTLKLATITPRRQR